MAGLFVVRICCVRSERRLSCRSFFLAVCSERQRSCGIVRFISLNASREILWLCFNRRRATSMTSSYASESP